MTLLIDAEARLGMAVNETEEPEVPTLVEVSTEIVRDGGVDMK
jgi:hypothetical protein